jgi:hypothetical protein
LQLDFSAQENMCDERLPIRLKQELPQRFDRLDGDEASAGWATSCVAR